ncbi:glycosyltransferase family 2 protein [Aestuariibacter sp. A3R04]|uniref:glycosyltransferase family 2 protein n=1 Tax=Aestuariibacter sp. A3R04 TaxID=2841571 RepID=UPI001C087320|nr:glycosyltransferase family 2 protein [Aestuariibacter sp. A3R04]MBU3021759.1 glycosyltransferase family 2 protein [Aestuariibacter sp. A3R04]
MTIFEVLFWVSVFIITYTYFIYPVLLIIASSLTQAVRDTRFVLKKASRRKANSDIPSVTVVIAAYNEEKCIRERVENLLSLEYPREKLTILIGSDGSNDDTNTILSDFQSYPQMQIHLFEENRGKINVLNDLLTRVDTPICVFSDANTFFDKDAVQRLVADFRHDDVGAVCGELELVDPFSGKNKDSLYWKYEQVLKFHENRINGMLGANGAIYAIRTELYRPLPSDTIIDDFCVFMNIAKMGYRLTYNPEARAKEEIAPNLVEEASRRIRIGAGNYQAMSRLTWALNPLIGARCFSYISHKVMRWFVPHCMLLALLSNVVLSFYSGGYALLLAAQILFYGLFTVGARSTRDMTGKLGAVINLITFFVSMNISLGRGFVRFLTTRQTATWERTAR